MQRIIATLLIACCCCITTRDASAAAPQPIAVLGIQAKGRVRQNACDVFDTLLQQGMHARQLAFIGHEDIKQLVQYAHLRDQLGCRIDDETCLVELGLALGAQEIVYGTAGRLGRTLVVSLKRLRTQPPGVIAQATWEKKRARDGALRHAVEPLLNQLYDPSIPAPRASLDPINAFEPNNTPSLATHPWQETLLWWTGAAGVSAAAFFGTRAMLSYNDEQGGHAGQAKDGRYALIGGGVGIGSLIGAWVLHALE